MSRSIQPCEIADGRIWRTTWHIRVIARTLMALALIGLILPQVRGQTAQLDTTVAQPHSPRTTEERAASGGGAQADFDTLIDLIQATVAPDTWDDVGGDGSIQGFPGGVYVDAQGVLRQLSSDTNRQLAARWNRWNRHREGVNSSSALGNHSELRKVSLMQLLKVYQELQSQKLEPTDEMMHMAGLARIDYLVFDWDQADWIVAGPAGPWIIDDEGRHVSRESGRPIVRLEDLLLLLQNAFVGQGKFMCAITPTQAGLAQAQQFAVRSAANALPVGRRKVWLQEFASALGLQRIEVTGIAANTRVARVIVEADHHMKRIGIGLQTVNNGVPSYLERLVESEVLPEHMEVLRWWFTLHPEAVQIAERNRAYVFGSQAVQVLSENELLTRTGQRVHTGRSEPLNERFAFDFTQRFTQIAQQYPVYGDLDNVFRLSLVAAIIRQQGFPRQESTVLAEWLQTTSLPQTTGRAPAWVPSIVNDRQFDRTRFIAAASGGVTFSPPRLSTLPDASTNKSVLELLRPGNRSQPIRWWWD